MQEISLKNFKKVNGFNSFNRIMGEKLIERKNGGISMKKTVVLAVTVLTLSMAGTAVFAAGRGNEFGQNNSGTRMNCGRNCIYTNCGAGFVDENGDGICDNYGNGNGYGNGIANGNVNSDANDNSDVNAAANTTGNAGEN